MKKIEWICCLVLALFVCATALPTVVCFAQQDEEEEPIQARPNPMTKPNPMERSMRKPAMSETLMLNDGRQLQQGSYAGKQVWFLIGANGQRTLANGSFTLQNGAPVTLQGGAMSPTQMRNLPQMK